nr:hypothetical protein [Candidatus Sigynarchaeota archaeon]
MTKNTRIKDSSPGGSSMNVRMQKLHKKISQSLKKLEESVVNIVNVGNDERKVKVQAISSELYDLAEHLHDLNMGIDEIVGDDLINVDEENIQTQFELIEMNTALIGDFETHVKNLHKTYYDTTIENDLKLIVYEDFNRKWKSLSKNLARTVTTLQKIISELNEA